MKNIFTLIALISLISFTACHKEEIEQEFVPNSPETSTLSVNDKVSSGNVDFTINNEDNLVFEKDALLLTNNSVNAVSYQWDFGNGDSSSKAQPNYKYEMHGIYTVKLTITDIYGEIHQTSHDITVLCVFGGGVHNQ